MSAKRLTLTCACAACLIHVGISFAAPLPTGKAPPPIRFSHFPDRLHTFVWRNWELASLERMAEVLRTTPQNVRRIGRSMGLPEHVTPPDEYQRRAYISLIRRNWHLLPYDQLLTLLGWDAEKLAFTLREDDFLWIKLGSLKPSCPPLRYEKPNQSAIERCDRIENVVLSQFADEFAGPARPRFDFIRTMPVPSDRTRPATDALANEPIRFLYSYFGVFGDPLLNPELDPYPDTLLRSLADAGVNGVWLHTVLRQLAPSTIFTEFGKDHQTRLENLGKLVNRAKNHGIKIYLYINEPRAMPSKFFDAAPEIRGVRQGDYCALCTSAPPVRQWIEQSLCFVFERVPDLGGVFTITASENLTNCYSHSRTAAGCPRCAARSGPQVIAEVCRTIAAGVWKGNPQAAVIIWDWGWPDGADTGWGRPDWATEIIEALPDNVYLMSVSEWGKPITRGGVPGAVGEYSISAVGPGPRAQRHWALAGKRGLKTIAKVQVNASWELSAVPYLPVMNLVARHCDNLAKAGVDGLMLSWTVGGYPSPNLSLVRQFQSQSPPTVQHALTELALSRYGPRAAPDMLAAWSAFSDAFAEYPFHIRFVYSGPAQYGPANLLYPEPTGYAATMVGFPYDDLEGWRGIYPADVLAGQFEKMAARWRQGLSASRNALKKITAPDARANAQADLDIAEAACLHFRSVANQVRFTSARNALLSPSLSPAERNAKIQIIEAVLADEITNAKRLFVLTRRDPRIGFEASNHYYYLPLDLVEKVINCDDISNVWLPSISKDKP